MEEELDEKQAIIDDLPKLPIEFHETMTQVLLAKPNAYVAYNPLSGRLEIYPTKGGWIGIDADAAFYDYAPFCD